jgi:hypothetical protein
MRILNAAGMMRRNAWDAVSETELIAWCDRYPDARYAAAAEGITAFHWSDPNHPQWSPIALKLLDKAPNRTEVLKKFTQKFSPLAWSGSLAGIIETNSRLLDHFAGYDDPVLIAFIISEKERFRRLVDSERNSEKVQRAWSEGFEF